MDSKEQERVWNPIFTSSHLQKVKGEILLLGGNLLLGIRLGA